MKTKIKKETIGLAVRILFVIGLMLALFFLSSCQRETTTFRNIKTGEVIALYDHYDLAMFDSLIIKETKYSHIRDKKEIWGIYAGIVPPSSFAEYPSYRDSTEIYTSYSFYYVVVPVRERYKR